MTMILRIILISVLIVKDIIYRIIIVEILDELYGNTQCIRQFLQRGFVDDDLAFKFRYSLLGKLTGAHLAQCILLNSLHSPEFGNNFSLLDLSFLLENNAHIFSY